MVVSSEGAALGFPLLLHQFHSLRNVKRYAIMAHLRMILIFHAII